MLRGQLFHVLRWLLKERCVLASCSSLSADKTVGGSSSPHWKLLLIKGPSYWEKNFLPPIQRLVLFFWRFWDVQTLWWFNFNVRSFSQTLQSHCTNCLHEVASATHCVVIVSSWNTVTGGFMDEFQKIFWVSCVPTQCLIKRLRSSVSLTPAKCC